MEIETFDILLLFTLALALAMIIGINVLYIVDKKLGDVQINVPACPKPFCPRPVCPTPICSPKKMSNNVAHTTPHTTSKSLNDHIQKKVPDTIHKVSTKYTSKDGRCTVDLNKSFPMVSKKDNIRGDGENVESFEDVTKSNEDGNNIQYLGTNQTVLPMVITQDSTPTTRNTILLKQGYNKTGGDKPNVGNDITYPSADDVVRYRGPGCYQNIDTKNIRKLKIDDVNNKTRRPYTDGSVREDSYNQIKSGFMTPSSNDPDRIVQQDIRFYVPRVYMGVDPYMSGISYAGMRLENPADIDQIGSIPVNNFNGEPVPISSFMSNDD